MDTNPMSPEERRHRTSAYLFLAVACILWLIAYLVGISDNPPGAAALVLGVFSFILGIVYRFGKSGGRTPGQNLLYWTPRVLCITLAVLLSGFALDVFEGGKSFWAAVPDWLMHLVPNFLMLIVLAVSWRREWISGYLFVALGVLYAVVTRSTRPFIPWSGVLLIAVPFVLIGALLLLNWHYRGVLRERSKERATPRWLLPGIAVLGFVAVPVLYFAFSPTMEPVTFRADAPAAKQVFVAGSFNGWNPRQYPLSRQPQGQWQTTIALPAGRYEYKFIVDTEWVHDVNNPNTVPLAPPMEGFNSVLNVGGQDSLSPHR